MTQEEKAKAYDEALWKAKTHINAKGIGDTVDLCKHLFPELAESEDERIRKNIIRLLQVGGYMPLEDKEKAFAYLEKQKGQKPVQSDTEKEYVHTLKSIIFDFLRGKQEVDKDYYQQIENWLDGRHVERKPIECIEFDNEFENQVSHLLASVLNGEHEYNEGFVKYVSQSLLGYAKKEQKPAEWGEEDEIYLQDALWCVKQAAKVARGENDMGACWSAERWLKSLPEKFVLQQKQEWNEEDEKTLDCIINILDRLEYEEFCKSSRDQDVEGERFYYKEIQCLKRLKSLRHQQKVEWSEEDRTILKVITSDVARMMHRCGVGTDEAIIRSKAIRWLETLCPNQKSEWSKEDEKKYQCIRSILLTDVDKKVGSWKYSEILEWYEKKGIGRYTNSEPSWKPNEEQMNALLYAMSFVSPATKESVLLSEIYENLKKCNQ